MIFVSRKLIIDDESIVYQNENESTFVELEIISRKIILMKKLKIELTINQCSYFKQMVFTCNHEFLKNIEVVKYKCLYQNKFLLLIKNHICQNINIL